MSLCRNTISAITSPYSVQKVVSSDRAAVEVDQDCELPKCLLFLQRKIWKYVLHLGYEVSVF